MNENLVLKAYEYFKLVYDIEFTLGKDTKYNEDFFNQVFNDFLSRFKCSFSKDEYEILKRKVDSEFQIYQPDGEVLQCIYEHDDKWYTKIKDEINHFYWNRYRKYLLQKGWPINIVHKLEFDTLDRIMNLLGNVRKADPFNRRGLVMGDVQSGKTSNYIGLINKAADAGYKVIILLSGVIEALRKQTQIRVEEGFIGYDVYNRKWVGVGIDNEGGDPIPHSVTSRENDFTGISGDSTGLRILNDSNVPHIFITKKNATTLKKIKDALRDINIIPPQEKINSSLLIIDDEADNASINTNDVNLDPTRINKEIRELRRLFKQSNYVGFTATPFANVFIDPNSETEMLESDLFPEDFIYVLNPPSNYYGAEKIFLNNTSKTVQIIDDSNESFPLIHSKDWDGNDLFPSFDEALYVFLLSNSIRDLREGILKNSHRSMLVNVSKFIKVQDKIARITAGKLEKILNAIKYSYKVGFEEYIQNSSVRALYDLYNKHYKDCFTWELVFDNLYDAIKDIEIYQVPTRDKKKILDYEKHKEKGLRCIVIGGFALSRGLTLEGLTVSYLYRNTSTFDVLMQMGRWFGYRNNPVEYGDLCKVWMLQKTKEYFIEITKSVKQLKDDFSELYKSGKTPSEFGIRVRNESENLGITSRNKMRSTKKYVHMYDLYGQVLETPFINSNIDIIKNNLEIVNNLIKDVNFKNEAKSYIAKNIEKKKILEILSKIDIHEANSINYFEKNKILDFINTKLDNDKFDVVIVGGDSNSILRISNIEVTPILRKFDFLNESVIRVNAKHRRLGGKSDTRFGLSINERKKINEEKASNSSYMIEGRNPLLLIYFIEFKKVLEEDSEFSHFEKKLINQYVDLLKEKHLFPIGLGIGFPRNSQKMKYEKEVYIINVNTKWYNLMDKKDSEYDE